MFKNDFMKTFQSFIKGALKKKRKSSKKVGTDCYDDFQDNPIDPIVHRSS